MGKGRRLSWGGRMFFLGKWEQSGDRATEKTTKLQGGDGGPRGSWGPVGEAGARGKGWQGSRGPVALDSSPVFSPL